MPQLTTLFWRDIPAQVIAKQGRQRARQQLAGRFQEAIDRAAMRAKKISADAYLDDWRRVSVKVSSDNTLEQLVADTAKTLDTDYHPERLDALIRNHGLAPEST